MLTPTTIPGATYGEYWPDGTGATSLTLPPGLTTALLHFRVAADGRIAGQAHQGGAALYWNGAAWLTLGSSTGISVCAFHPTSGQVYVSDAPGVYIHNRDGINEALVEGYIGSQGIRWVNPDGTVVSGDATYGIPGQLGQYTTCGDVTIGQGLAGGVDAIVDGVLRHVCDGVAEFLRVNRVGDAFALYWTDYASGYRLNTTLAELRALPAVTPPTPEPVPPDPEPEPPQPEPEPPEPTPEPPDGGIDMTPQQIAIRGFAGQYARIDPGELGQGPFGGFPIHWDRESVSEWETFELSKPDDKYQIKHCTTGVILGADATSFSADLTTQFYTSGGDVTERGAYESWTVFRLRAGGTICALIEYDQDGIVFCSADLTVEEL